jgi:hypothetical protein
MQYFSVLLEEEEKTNSGTLTAEDQDQKLHSVWKEILLFTGEIDAKNERSVLKITFSTKMWFKTFMMNVYKKLTKKRVANRRRGKETP